MAEEQPKAKDDSIGALWLKKTRNNEDLLSGSVTVDGKKIDIVGFVNKYKTEDKHPTYRLFISKPREGGYQAPAQAPKPQAQTDSFKKATKETDDIDISEIPFS